MEILICLCFEMMQLNTNKIIILEHVKREASSCNQIDVVHFAGSIYVRDIKRNATFYIYLRT
jgi:hypothetical protein